MLLKGISMSIYKIRKGMQINIDANPYLVTAVWPNGKVRLRTLKGRKQQFASEQTLLQAAIYNELDLPLSDLQISLPPRVKPASLVLHFHRLDLFVRCNGKAERPWICTMIDARTRCPLGFAMVCNQELVLRLNELSQPSHPIEYDLFGDRTNLVPARKGELL